MLVFNKMQVKVKSIFKINKSGLCIPYTKKKIWKEISPDWRRSITLNMNDWNFTNMFIMVGRTRKQFLQEQNNITVNDTA